jgi:hypothetical protein
MVSLNRLPDQDVQSGPKEPSESQVVTRKKERPHPRFA